MKRKFQAGRFAGITLGRTRLYEHAETGKSDGFSDENRSLGTLASNGPAHVDPLVGMGLVAILR